MPQMVVVKSKTGHVIEMNKLSFDRIWGPKGRKGGYELATEEDIKAGLTPRVLNLPPGVKTVDDLDEEQAKQVLATVDVSTAVAPTSEALELTKTLQSAGEREKVTTGDPGPGTANTPLSRRVTAAGSPASTDTGNSSQQSS